ncbi:ABC transporter ATP-binding protein [Pedobacter flavus]|uniref:ABC transporter ATP-binding protein n=1 Tax=Pedobacter flavus TaxID=3113906 RepID=A0ABU7H0C0_9SPHI|nr:ABC transporter ATP-binding protein [Pedobacter sp. VNH31]MEE1884699.1 ABC transporter ATP-binding protein [Pedobacter sp. VNH31]
MKKVIKVENLSKAYQLGQFNTGTISNDLKRWWALKRGKEDPFLMVGETNDRTKAGTSNVVWSLKDINFELNQGDTVGIIGRNGAGKSTLLKVLSQITSPTTGSVKIKGRIASLLEVGTGFHPELSGRENIFLNGAILGMSKREIASKFDEIVDFSGVERYLDTPVKRYSSGMYVRLAFAVAAHLESEILIVDEVLAVGDAEFQKKCLGKMNQLGNETGRTIVFVSHNMTSIKALCKRSMYLKYGQLVNFGETTDIISEYLKDSGEVGSKSGIIPPNLSLHGTGEAKFTSLRAMDASGLSKQEFSFADKITVEVELDVNIDLKDVLIGVHLLNVYGEKIAMDVMDKNYKPYSLDKGKYKITINSEDLLMPGDYSFALSISHFYSGADIDFIESFASFRIVRESANNEINYPWPTIHGYYRPLSSWKTEKIG